MDATPREQGRVDYLRLSITDRCNLRCTYCMPPEGVETRGARRDPELRGARGFHARRCRRRHLQGPRHRRRAAGATGLRRPRRHARRTSGIHDLSLTTNGLLLPRYAGDLRGERPAPGQHQPRQPRRGRASAAITRGGDLEDALAGIDAAFSAGFSPVKINTLLLPGVEEELDAFVALTREYDVHVRFIEFMPLDRRIAAGDDLGGAGHLLPAGDILRRLMREHVLIGSEGPYGHGPAQYWRVAGARGTIGFIAGVSDHFCDTCNRLRLTADGRLRTCLFSGRELDVRPLIGDPGALRGAIETAVAGKTFDRCAEALANDRSMSQIGG